MEVELHHMKVYTVERMQQASMQWVMLIWAKRKTEAYVKDDQVKEDKQDVHHDAHNELQLADYASCILQSIGQILPLLVYLHMH